MIYSNIRLIALLCTILKESKHESAWIVSCGEIFYSAKIRPEFLKCNFLKAGLYCYLKKFMRFKSVTVFTISRYGERKMLVTGLSILVVASIMYLPWGNKYPLLQASSELNIFLNLPSDHDCKVMELVIAL